jgi:hypothetical protein
MTDQFPSKFTSRKYHLAVAALLMMFVLAMNDKLTAVAAGGLIAAAGIYSHYNLKQKRDALEAKLETELSP